MSSGEDLITTLKAFIELHQRSRQQALSPDAKARYQELKLALSQTINGARNRQTEPSKPAPFIKDVQLQTNNSSYTPSSHSPLSEAYYGSVAHEPAVSANTAPSQVVNALGGPITLPNSIQAMWGITPDSETKDETTGPSPSGELVNDTELWQPSKTELTAQTSPITVPSRPLSNLEPTPALRHAEAQLTDQDPSLGLEFSSEPTSITSAFGDEQSSTQITPLTPQSDLDASSPLAAGAPAIIHLRASHALRGTILQFSQSAGHILVEAHDEAKTWKRIKLEDVFAIVVGRSPEVQPSPSGGLSVEVQLTNKRRISGYTDDYQPNGRSLTVIPKNQKNGVDRIWVPAWSVESITTD